MEWPQATSSGNFLMSSAVSTTQVLLCRKRIYTDKRAKWPGQHSQAQCLQAESRAYDSFSKQHRSNTLLFFLFSFFLVLFSVNLLTGISCLSSSNSLCREVWQLWALGCSACLYLSRLWQHQLMEAAQE